MSCAVTMERMSPPVMTRVWITTKLHSILRLCTKDAWTSLLPNYETKSFSHRSRANDGSSFDVLKWSNKYGFSCFIALPFAPKCERGCSRAPWMRQMPRELLVLLPEFTATDKTAIRYEQTDTAAFKLFRWHQDKLRDVSRHRWPLSRSVIDVMVETPAGCLFEDIQYEDIQVEAVNFPTVAQERELLTLACFAGVKCSGTAKFK